MIENYIMQALLIGMILIVSARVMMTIYNAVNRCRKDFAEVAELELLDPRPIRVPRSDEEPEDQADESASEAEVAADEDHINTV